MSEVKYKVEAVFGYRQLVETFRRKGDRVLLGGYSILYDTEGREVSRTEPEDTCEVTFS